MSTIDIYTKAVKDENGTVIHPYYEFTLDDGTSFVPSTYNFYASNTYIFHRNEPDHPFYISDQGPLNTNSTNSNIW